MMPGRSAVGRPGPGGAGGPSRPGAPTRGGAGGGRGGFGGGGGAGRPGGPGGPGGPGAPAGGRGFGKGGGGRGGTQGAFGRAGGRPVRGRKSKKQRRQEFDNMQAPIAGGVQVPRGDGSTIVRLRRGASLTDFAEKINANPASLVTVLFHLGEMATATQSLDEDTFRLLGEELGYDIQIVSPEDEDRELLERFVDRHRGRGGGATRSSSSRGRRSSPSWVTSTTARRSCSTRSGTRTSWPARPVASPSTSVPTRCTSSTRASTGRSPSSTPRVTRRSRPCVPVVRRSPTSPCSSSRPTTA